MDEMLNAWDSVELAWYFEDKADQQEDEDKELVARSLKLAEGFFLYAADQGDGFAKLRLAQIYEKGNKGVRKNRRQSALWYREAAHHPEDPLFDDELRADAEFNYATMLDEGNGVPRDEIQAGQFYKKAAQKLWAQRY